MYRTESNDGASGRDQPHVHSGGGRLEIRSIEVNLCDTCNLRCAHCASSAPYLSDPNHPDLAETRMTLEHLARVARVRELRLLGGEPLLNPEILDYLRVCRATGVAERIKVVTNGLLLPSMGDAFWRLTDAVRISVYPSTRKWLTDGQLEVFRTTASRWNCVIEVADKPQFQEAVSDQVIADATVVARTFAECNEAHLWSCHLLYRRHLYRCARVHTIDRYLDTLGVVHEAFTELDGLPIDDRATLRMELESYLGSTTPLKACNFCFGTSGAHQGHRQLTRVQIQTKVGASAERSTS